MASFLHSSYPTRHSEADRGVAPVQAGNAEILRGFDSTKGLSAMLLAAMVSALVVVADQLIDTRADGHLLATWVALWVVGFFAVAMFAGAARKLAVTAVNVLNAWSERIARTRADEHLWAMAKADSRVMADLSAAITRAER